MKKENLKSEKNESQKFIRAEHIKKSSEIKKNLKEGKKVSICGAKLFFTKNSLGFNRIAFLLSREFKNSVKRNRAKRFGREVFRQLKNQIEVSFDFLFLVYPSDEDSFFLRRKQFESLCKKAGILKIEQF